MVWIGSTAERSIDLSDIGTSEGSIKSMASNVMTPHSNNADIIINPIILFCN